VRHEHDVYGVIFAAQPGRHPKEKSLGQLPIALRHAAGDVEQEKDHGAHRRLAASRELAESQILIGEGRRVRVLGAAFDRFLEGTPAIQAGARPAPVPPLAFPFGFLGSSDPWLQIGELHVLPEPLDDVVHFELEQEFGAASLFSAGAFLSRTAGGIRLPEHIAGFGLPLTDALRFAGVPQPKAVMFEHAHGDSDRA